MRVISVDETGAPYRVDVTGDYSDLFGAWRTAQRYRDLNPGHCYIAGNLTGATLVEASPSDEPR